MGNRWLFERIQGYLSAKATTGFPGATSYAKGNPGGTVFCDPSVTIKCGLPNAYNHAFLNITNNVWHLQQTM